ncbi:hypothetical protein CS542_04780 [Pedobacter sp. IW39]|nr:hypothetical protein CS542_04780 [Pedobacter sp. IW39]
MKHFKLILWFSFCLPYKNGSGFQNKGSFIDGKDTISYRILFPEHFDPNKISLLFLHGSGSAETITKTITTWR